MSLIELEQEAKRLKVTWQKAQNYYNTFAVDFARIKRDFESGKYNTTITFPAWLFQNSGLIESRVVAELSAHAKSLSAEDREAIEADILRKKNEEAAVKLAEQNEKKRIQAEKLAAQTAALEERNKQIAEQARLNAEARALREQEARETKESKEKIAKIKKPKQTKPKQPRKRKPVTIDNSISLEQCAKNIHAGTKKVNKGKAMSKEGKDIWIEGIMEVAVNIAAARNQFQSDIEFGNWTSQNNINAEYDRNEIPALIRCGSNLELYKKEMEQSESISIRNIDAAIRQQHLRVVG